MDRCCLILLGLVLGSSLALAQPSHAPSESVTVTATKIPEAEMKSFVAANTAPTRLAEKIARWKGPLCPQTLGLPAKYAEFINQHIMDVAKRVGAPTGSKANCKPNIRVVFTTKPQELLNNILAKSPDFLGYHDSGTEGEHLAKVVRSMQAWYLTATVDLRGNIFVDSRHGGGMVVQMPNPIPGMPGQPYIEIYLPNAREMNVTGNRLGDGLSSALAHVLIVAEPGKLLNYEMGTVGDYIAMLALSQPPTPNGCQPMPSILNLLETQCEPGNALSNGDLAYLTALYKMGVTDTLQQQREELLYSMRQSVGGQLQESPKE
jgi:hypothetical protein